MRVMGGQVHLGELLLLSVVSLLAHAIGYAIPIFALILSVFWPLLILQFIFEGALYGLYHGLRRLIFGKRKEPEPEPSPYEDRTGVAKYIWWLPMIALTAGYARHVIETGRWLW